MTTVDGRSFSRPVFFSYSSAVCILYTLLTVIANLFRLRQNTHTHTYTGLSQSSSSIQLLMSKAALWSLYKNILKWSEIVTGFKWNNQCKSDVCLNTLCCFLSIPFYFCILVFFHSFSVSSCRSAHCIALHHTSLSHSIASTLCLIYLSTWSSKLSCHCHLGLVVLRFFYVFITVEKNRIKTNEL